MKEQTIADIRRLVDEGIVDEPIDFPGGWEGGDPPLGNTTVLASSGINTALQKKARKKAKERQEYGEVVKHQYELLDFLNRKLPDPGQYWDEKERRWVRARGQRWRARSCKRIPVMGGDVELVRTSGSHVHYRGVNHCDSVWTCPVCSAKVAAFRREELSRAIAGSNCWVALSTFTLRHKVTDRLSDLLAILRKAYRSMRSGRRWQDLQRGFKLVGSYTSMEFTVSSENGWHPHLHALDVFETDMDEQQLKEWREAVTDLWVHAMEKATGQVHSYSFQPSLSGNQALIQAYYAVKWGSSEEAWNQLMKRKAGRSQISHAVAEVTGALTKQGLVLQGVHYSMWELLDLAADGSLEAWNLWFEFAEATRTLHQGSWSRGLRTWLGLGSEIPDAEVPEESEGPEVLVRMTAGEWSTVVRWGWRGILLRYASTHESLGVGRYVEWLLRQRSL
jgi:hypothetical protein